MVGWIAATTTAKPLPSVSDRDFAHFIAEEDRTPHQPDAVARISALGDELIAADWPGPDN